MRVILISLLPLITLISAYTWPSPQIDELEDIIYLQSGYQRRGFRDGILGCTFVPAGSKDRQASSEWLRTAFHDMITHDKAAGTGGLDASLMYELDRPENQGVVGLNDTFGFFFSFHNSRASMADLVAIGVYASVRECGGPVVPIRGGRIDAHEAGPAGVPEPKTDLETTTARFATAGFTTEDMIAMVACGHTLGGVHGNNHPEVTGNNSAANFPKFDSTTFKFDNNVVTEYLQGNTTNPLVVGPDEMNSDKRVFSADKNVTMQSLADPSTFRTSCASILERMINTVPASVTLTDVITPIDIKPSALQVYLANATAIHLEGAIRVRITERTPPDSVSMPYIDHNGNSCDTCTISTRPAIFQGGSGTGYDDSFKFYEFSTSLPIETSISTFNVAFAGENHDNSGGGFPIRTEILHQPQ
ncbi:wsc domain containing protein [Moniliophthora roreri]|uniref:Peroxidase n=1 Tax=Moniliophthora roreri TaxID=221103 RepID=A0A0W0FVD2_MONRR|nr:wsc domain containing protein [Moniliophthora roreri]